jgi:hypothetical protein
MKMRVHGRFARSFRLFTLAMALLAVGSMVSANPSYTTPWDDDTSATYFRSLDIITPLLRAEVEARVGEGNAMALRRITPNIGNADRQLGEFALRCPDASEELSQAVMIVALQYPFDMTKRAIADINEQELLEHWEEIRQGGLPYGLEFARNLGHNVTLRKEMERRASLAEDPTDKGGFLEIAAELHLEAATLFRLRSSAERALAIVDEMRELGHQPANPFDEATIARLGRMAAGEFSDEDAPPIPWEVDGEPYVPLSQRN